MSLMSYLLAFAFIVAIQGFLVRSACTICEVEPPSYLSSLGMAWTAWGLSTVVAFVWTWTFGVVVWIFVGKMVTSILAAIIGWLVGTLIYKKWLEIGFVHAGLIWTIYGVAAAILSGAIYGLLSWVF